MQIPEQEILTVIASFVLHFCAIKNNFIVVSKLYNVVDVVHVHEFYSSQ